MPGKPPIRWFRFGTLPLFIAGVLSTIVAAERSSANLMYAAVVISTMGLFSLILGRHVINPPEPIVEHQVKTIPQEHKSEHAIAHR